jgi:hypothetical protein
MAGLTKSRRHRDRMPAQETVEPKASCPACGSPVGSLRVLFVREGVTGEQPDSDLGATCVRPCVARRVNEHAEEPLICSGFFKPSDGLEPSTPSLP